MSASDLFLVGFAVMLIVAAALALLIYAAILDGREGAARELARAPVSPPVVARSVLEVAHPAPGETTYPAATTAGSA
jgi:hypothetical protein